MLRTFIISLFIVFFAGDISLAVVYLSTLNWSAKKDETEHNTRMLSMWFAACSEAAHKFITSLWCNVFFVVSFWQWFGTGFHGDLRIYMHVLRSLWKLISFIHSIMGNGMVNVGFQVLANSLNARSWIWFICSFE